MKKYFQCRTNNLPKSHVNWIYIAVFVLVANLFPNALLTSVLAWDNGVVHPKITEKAINFVNINFGLQEVYNFGFINISTDPQCSYIDEGSVKEDLALTSFESWDTSTWGTNACLLLGLNWVRHGYNPVTGSGWVNLSPINAVDYSIGIWNNALTDYRNGYKGDAYFQIGRLTHLLEDMSSPAHAQTDYHGGGDDAENWGKGRAFDFDSGNYDPSIIRKPSTHGYGSLTADLFENFMKNLAWDTYYASTFQGKLVTEFGDVQPDSELKRMFPSVRYENDWYSPDYWTIPDVGIYLNGLDPFGSNGWWLSEGNNSDGTGYYYLENLDKGISDWSDPLVPAVKRNNFFERIYDGDNLNSKLISNSTSLVNIYASNLYPRSAEWVAGLLQFFYQEVDNTSPTVVSRLHSASSNTNIYITFSEDMDDTTFSNSTITVSGSSSESHSNSYSFNHSTYELTINPTSNFSYGENVNVTIGTGVKDIAGNNMASPYVFSFNIESSPPPPPSSISCSASAPSSATAYEPITVSGTATYNNNTGYPVTSGTATITNGEENWTAPLDSNGNFSQTINAPGSSRNVTVYCDDGSLPTGIDNVYITITGNSSFPYNITTDIIDNAWDDGISCQSNCVHWTAKDSFRTTDEGVYGLTYLTTNDRFGNMIGMRYRFYRPDGSQYGQTLTDDSVCDPDNYYWCYNWWGFLISGNEMASKPGRYTVKFYLNENWGSYQKIADDSYVVGWDFTEHRMAQDVEGPPNYLPDTPTNTFYTTDAKALTWANFDFVAQSIEIKWEFYEPNGSIYSTPFTYTTTDPSSEPGCGEWCDWVRAWGWIDINGYTAANKPGDWYVKVFIKNPVNGTYEEYYTDYFNILENPAVSPTINVSNSPVSPIESQYITLNASANDNTYLKKVILHWNDGADHVCLTQDNIYSNSYSGSCQIGPFSAGQNIEYWAEAWDSSGNRTESTHQTITIQFETVYAPDRPSGEAYRQTDQVGTYVTDGSTTNLSHSVEYQFDWGDGSPLVWGSTSQNHSWTTEGTYYIKVKARCQTHTTRESNWSSTFTVGIDSTSPTGSIFINSDDAYTNSISVTLAANAGDANGVAEMQFSNDNSNWSFPEPYSPTKSWSLTSGDGSKTVYVKFKDTADNWSIAYSDTIELDTTSPSDGSLTATPGDSQIDLNWSGFSDSGSGLNTTDTYKLVYSTSGSPSVNCADGTDITSVTTQTSYPHTGLTNDTAYYYRLCAYDNVNNLSSGVTASETPVHIPVDRYITDSGTDSGDCTNPISPCATIQYSINQSGDGDTIKVAQGTYNENISITSSISGLLIEGGWDSIFTARSNNPSLTIIDGGGIARVFNISATGISIGVTIEGFTIQNGIESPYGGGINVVTWSGGVALVDIINNIIAGNSANNGGGIGVYSKTGSPIVNIINNKISNNGGISAVYISSEIADETNSNLINNVIADNDGYGIFITTHSALTQVTITNNTITNNGSSGLLAQYDNTIIDITNSLIWGNSGDDIYFWPLSLSTINISHSDVGQVAINSGNYNDDGTNLNTAPLFVDSANGNHHLSHSSPLINMGDNSAVSAIPTDFEGDPRIIDGAVDIGADEYRDWIAIAVGYTHSIALKSDGSLWSWGWNEYGQLGDGTTTNRNFPVQIGVDYDWVSIAAGFGHNIALKSNGSLWTWGRNDYGQLGYSTSETCPFPCSTSPKKVGTDTDWIAISGGNHTVALKSNNSLWAWGANSYGQVGDGTTIHKSSPVQIGTDNDWVTVDAGGYFSVALKVDGSLWAWGNNANGQLGDGTTINRYSPIPIGSDTDWTEISAGGGHTVALKVDGSLWAWGYNIYGQLGDGSTNTDNDWTAISAGGYHTVALKSDGSLWAWGKNTSGELGDGTTTSRASPAKIGIDNDWTASSAWYNSTMALKSDGSLWEWGLNINGQWNSPYVNYYCDVDGDDYKTTIVGGSCTGNNCKPVGCQLIMGIDCDDANVSVNPEATEIADDGIDQNCNGFDTVTCIVDADQDGYGIDLGTTTLASDGTCDMAQSESSTADDCDDNNPSINPGVADIADDGIDQDCNGSDTVTCIVDSDQDGYGTDLGTTTLASDGTCDIAQSESTTSDDCDDKEPTSFPGNPEICDANDNDCDGYLNNGISDCFMISHINEAFDYGTPIAWTIIDNAGTSAVWRFDDPRNRSNLTGGAGLFAIADSDYHGTINMDTELRTSVIDMSNLSSVQLEFNTDFRYYSGGGSEVADVDISVDGGTTWIITPLWSKSGSDYRGPHTEVLDISALAAGQSNVMIRFHFYNANYDWWWQIDDVQIIGRSSEVCAPPVRISGYFYYPTIQSAYDDTTDGDTIQCQATLNAGDLYIDMNKAVNLEGSYDCSYSTNAGITTVNGDMVISDGVMTIANGNIQITDFTLIPDTGQTGDYTATFGEDSDYTINPPSYTDNGDGTVTDNVTGLMWQQEDDNQTYNWFEATGTYDATNNPGTTDVCDSSTLASYLDWRLPDKYELESIVDYGLSQPLPTIDSLAFPNTNSSYYWSSNTFTNYPNYAWAVSFWGGAVDYDFKTDGYFIRCVRDGQSTNHSFAINGDGTVTDNVTGLMWQQEDDDITRDWESAIAYCENLIVPPTTYSDWRLPNSKELFSIVDNLQYSPAIDSIAFLNTNSSYYWSSTTYTGTPTRVWYVRKLP